MNILFACEIIEFLERNFRSEIMRTIQLNVPDYLELKDYDFLMIVAVKLYEDAKISAGQAAELAGLSKRAFVEMLGKYGVSIFSTSSSDLIMG